VTIINIINNLYNNRWYRSMVLAAALPCLGLAGGSAIAQGLPMDKTLPLALATEAAQAALSACEQQRYRVSVAVVDRSGLVRILLRGDGAAPHTIDSSTHKAYTSASLRLSTQAATNMLASNPTAEGLRHVNDKILILAGGLPIKADEEVVGGIGVGGAPGGDKDEICAQAGIDKIKERLK
jgi:uncharacterized protein GlcG (DUF336 family)